MTAADKFRDYLCSFDIDPDEIHIERITKSGYDANVTMPNGQVLPFYRSWPPSFDTSYLFSLAIQMINEMDTQ